ncbi:class I SAM-dependent methyltransferase [Flavobacteriaceae bacterium]|nr:class I SAM-dependent methyltransferase [Flavobacteriaceae bacterium]MDC0133053.1 class I SAM-dependent methyltransferase [Flavobacteriaceae bacterium]
MQRLAAKPEITFIYTRIFTIPKKNSISFQTLIMKDKLKKIKWISDEFIKIENYKVLVSDNNLKINNSCIRKSTKINLILKKLLWPFIKSFSFIFIDGFIKEQIGKWIKEAVNNKSVFLDIGCGNFGLHKYISSDIAYNAIDLSLSEFQLRRILKHKNSNICIASAKQIPIETNSVSFVASTECFQHIPNFEEAADEMHRILKPGAILVCSNSNPYSKKYQSKGPHIGVYNMWTNKQFIDFMESKNFRLTENYMKGYWLPLPKWLTNISIQFPITSKKENLNTCFLYRFVVIK